MTEQPLTQHPRHSFYSYSALTPLLTYVLILFLKAISLCCVTNYIKFFKYIPWLLLSVDRHIPDRCPSREITTSPAKTDVPYRQSRSYWRRDVLLRCLILSAQLLESSANHSHGQGHSVRDLPTALRTACADSLPPGTRLHLDKDISSAPDLILQCCSTSSERWLAATTRSVVGLPSVLCTVCVQTGMYPRSTASLLPVMKPQPHTPLPN